MADAEIVVAPKAPKFEKVADKAAEKVEKVVLGAETVAEKVAEPVRAPLKDIQEKVTEAMHKAAETARNVVDVQRGAFETVVKAGQIYGEGLQHLATHAAEVGRTQFEDTMAHLRSLTSVKSVKEALELQGNFARTTASRYLTETSTLVEDYLKVAGNALAPVTTRAREAAEKVKNAA